MDRAVRRGVPLFGLAAKSLLYQSFLWAVLNSSRLTKSDPVLLLMVIKPTRKRDVLAAMSAAESIPAKARLAAVFINCMRVR